MDNHDKQKLNRERLLLGGIIFGISLALGFYIIVHFGSQIESQRENSSFQNNILLWILERIFIIIGIGLPFIIRKKLVEPYKDLLISIGHGTTVTAK